MPPLVTVAVNVVLWPLHKAVPALDTILTAGVIVPTVTVIAPEVAVVGDAHAAFEVIWHVMASLLTKLLVVYAEEVAPLIAVPFLYHW